ncbi:MAG: bifunctional 5,10-methylenetetrahydrofolate dehydrogenase/5,10-methenyltetrahydrofolate cyclohydrolase [Dethiobacteria bacterium]|jgi:methylenetetrahydrofolate dehydrogenase (NADP+)/methenyltetrahydrofolate cyclohydrolase
MPVKLLKEAEVGGKVCAGIIAELKELKQKTDKAPGLGMVVVGEDPASLASVRCKEKQCEKLGFYADIRYLPATASQDDICITIRQLNKESRVQGLFCQLPLPETLQKREILAAIDPGKDVGGRHPINAGKLFSGNEGFLPCNVYALMQVLDFAGQPIGGKTAVLISRRGVVSRPLTLALLKKNASVTFCPVLSSDLPKICRTADILVSETGKPGLIKGDWVKPGAMVMDIGTTPDGPEQASGFVLKEVEKVAGCIFTLPAGEDSPLAITMLMKNTLQAFKQTLFGMQH